MFAIAGIVAATWTGLASAQSLDLPALSPAAEVMQTVGVVELRVSYSSPGKRDRTIWGELVPYGELWRTGANAATTLEASGPFRIGDTEVEAGTYSLFTIPGEESWTVILNSNPQSSTGSYDEALDVARLEVAPLPGGERERLAFVFTDTTAEATRLDLWWDGVKVPIPIAVDTGAIVSGNVDGFVSGSAVQLARAARHFHRAGQHDRALELVETSIGIEESWYSVWTRAQILKDQGQRRKALKSAKRAMQLGKDDENFFWREEVEKALTDWRKG